MLIEVKAKVNRVVNSSARKHIETFLLDVDFFTQAEYAVTSLLSSQQHSGLVEGTVIDFHIQSLRLSPVKEIASQFSGDYSFIATLRDVFITDDGTEKPLRYKVLLFADDLDSATINARSLQRQGYQMLIESLRQVDYTYISPSELQSLSSESTNQPNQPE